MQKLLPAGTEELAVERKNSTEKGTKKETSTIEKEVKTEVELLNLNEVEKQRVDRQITQFRHDHMPLPFVKHYLHLFRDYYRYGNNPPQKYNDIRQEASRTHEGQIADRFKIYDGKDFSEYEQRDCFAEAFEKAKSLVEFPDLIKNGTGLLLLGEPGLGKTALAKTICTHIKDHAFIAAPKLTKLLKDVTNKERELIKQRFETATLLVIDDLGQEYRSEFTDSEIDYLIAERERNGRSVVITSNYTLEDMESEDGYAKRMIDRLKARCFITELRGKSYRQKQQPVLEKAIDG